MTLKNLGLAYGANVGTVNGFINRLEAQTGVLDDELRPAMDRLLRATGDVARSQELLNLSLDIAAGTGKSVTQVSQSLQKAYLGQTAAIGRLGVGISKAELATGNFEDIQKKLNLLFAGQAASAADTYQGSLNKLTVAGNNAKETIGKGLVDALGILSGAQTVDPAVSAIDKIANSIADATTDTAKFIKVIKTLFSDLSFFSNKNTVAEALRIKMGTGFTTPMTISSQDTQRADKLAAEAVKKAAAAQIAANKKIAAAKIAADKLTAANNAKLNKAAAVFDIQKIQIAAALKGKISEEEKVRLLLMQAIEDENADKAEALAKKLEEIQAKNAKIAADLAIISMTKDPFTTWAGSLSLALIELGKYGKTMADISSTTFIPGVHYNPSQNADRNYDNKLAAVIDVITEDAAAEIIADTQTNNLPIPSATATPINTNPFASLEGMADLFGFGSMGSMPTPATTTINITVEGSVLNGDEFSEIVNDALLNAERTGMPKTPAGFLIK
jgi:plasmid stability protein